jgi:hypothetical protein
VLVCAFDAAPDDLVGRCISFGGVLERGRLFISLQEVGRWLLGQLRTRGSDLTGGLRTRYEKVFEGCLAMLEVFVRHTRCSKTRRAADWDEEESACVYKVDEMYARTGWRYRVGVPLESALRPLLKDSARMAGFLGWARRGVDYARQYCGLTGRVEESRVSVDAISGARSVFVRLPENRRCVARECFGSKYEHGSRGKLFFIASEDGYDEQTGELEVRAYSYAGKHRGSNGKKHLLVRVIVTEQGVTFRNWTALM